MILFPGAAAVAVEEHRIVLDGREVAFRLRRSARRRRIVLSVDAAGLTVHVPWSASASRVQRVVRDAAGWVLRKLDARPDVGLPAARRWVDGEQVDFLGRSLRLALVGGGDLSIVSLLDADCLQVEVPDPADAGHVRAEVVRWYRRHATDHFARRVTLYSSRLAVPQPRLFLSDARGRWGSCNARREVRLNWRLLQAADHLIDYVVAHEVAHLVELNHSHRFWQLVAQLCPGYAAARSELNSQAHRLLAL